jgi:hypothetical protein
MTIKEKEVKEMTNMPGFNAEIVLNIPRGSYHAAMRNVDAEGITPAFGWGQLVGGVGGAACDLLPEPAKSICKMGTGIGSSFL